MIAEGELEAAASEPEAPQPEKRRRGVVVAIALLAVIALAAVSVAVVYAGKYRHDRDQRHDVTATASAMVSALTTYDYTNLDSSRNKVLALATGRFKQEYDAGFQPLRQVLTQTQAKSTGTVRRVFLGDVSDGSAEAIVVADQVVSGLTGSRPLAGQQLTVTLVKVGGHWRVDGLSVDATASGDTATPGASAATTTPTTRP